MASGATALARPPTVLSMAEVTALAQRLDRRAAQEQDEDLRLAAGVIRRMQAAHHSSDLLALLPPPGLA